MIDWKIVKDFEDITYKKCNGVARIAFNRPNVRNAFRPKTTSELYQAFYDAQEDTSIGVVLLSAEGPSKCARTPRLCRRRRSASLEYFRSTTFDSIYAESSYSGSSRLGSRRWT